MTFNYQVGGSLPADAPSYVERQCDRDYYDLLKERKYCYVFNCRQMGKSSLRVRVTHKLQAEGIVCATIDPQKIGVEVTCEQWYASAIRSLVGDLDLKSKFDLRSWIRERELLSPVQRFAEFIETVVLQEIDAPIVIFVEEIDRLLSLKFGMDDFFGLVRSFFEDRPTKPEYNRLTFSFLGVATPTDLIQSHNTSAFNIGYAVEMAGFTLTEALPLMQGLVSKVANPQDYLAEAVKWTGGQPFLIQRLLGMMEKELAGIAPPENIAGWVENLVQERIVTNWESQDAPPHLTTIRDRVISVEEKLRGRMLGCYQQVLADGELEDDRSEERSKLRLTGLVVRRDGRLISYNPIYGAVFNNAWVEGQLADLRPEFYASAFRAWRDAEEGQNQGFLLRGQALEEAEVWARGKKLSDIDEQFLRESREFERFETSQRLAATEKANAILVAAERKASDRVKVGSVVLGVMLLLAAAVGLWAARSVNESNLKVAETQKDAQTKLKDADLKVDFANKEADRIGKNAEQEKNKAAQKVIEADEKVASAQKDVEAAKAELENVSQQSKEKVLEAQAKIVDAEVKVKEATQLRRDSEQASLRAQANTKLALQGNSLEQLGSIALQQFDSDELNSLLKAMQGSQDLQELVRDGLSLDKYPAFSPLFALQKILNRISEKNQLRGHQGWVRSVRFNPDGQMIVTAGSDGTVQTWDALGKQQTKFKAHSLSILNINVSPDGQLIATASDDGIVRIWNLSGQMLHEYKHSNVIHDVAFSSNGNHIATVGEDGDISLWSLNDKQKISWQGDQGAIYSLSISPDSQYIATAGHNSSVKIWDLNGKRLAEFKNFNGRLLRVSFSPDGRLIATAGEDGKAKIWKMSGEQLAEFKAHLGWVRDISFSPDGRLIATAGEDGKAKIWKISGEQVGELKGHLGGVLSVSFNPQQNSLATGSTDGTARIWSFSNKQLKSNILYSANSFLMNAGSDSNTSCSSLYAPGLYPERVASSLFEDNQVGKIFFENYTNRVVEIKLYHPDSPGMIFGTYAVEPRATWTFPPEGQNYGFGSDWGIQVDNSKICILGRVANWNLLDKNWHVFKTSSDRFPLGTSPKNENMVSSLTFNRNGQNLAIAEMDGKVRILNSSGKELTQWKFGDSGGISTISFSPDGKYLATTAEGAVKIWNVSGQTITQYSGAYNMSFSHDGQYLATVLSDEQGDKVQIWDRWNQPQKRLLKRWSLSQSKEGHISVYSMSFSKDSQKILIAGTLQINRYSIVDSPVQLLDFSGQRLAEFKGHRGGVLSANFSPDEKAIITSGMDGTVRLWDFSGNQLIQWKAHQGWVRSAIFLDNQRIASVGDDGLVKVWSRSGQQLAEFAGHRGKISSMSFSSTDQTIVTSGYDGTVRIWHIDSLSELLTKGCGWLHNYLLTNNPNVSDEDRQMCGIAPR